MTDERPSLAILLWVYKDLPLCVNRAKSLRRLNPQNPIYVLYGGEPDQANLFEAALASCADDFFAFPGDVPPSWKWLHGDQLIACWFDRRGRHLDWDTIFVAQWDLLMLAPLAKLCARLEAGQLLLPGLRPIEEVEDWWWWVRPGSAEHADYRDFMALIEATWAMPPRPLCCNFIAAALPRAFLERYAVIAMPTVGFLEYKIPVYAQLWGFDFCVDHPFNPSWYHEESRSRVSRYLTTLHAEKTPIPTPTVLLNAISPWGRRVFHPYTKPYPPGVAADAPGVPTGRRDELS